MAWENVIGTIEGLNGITTGLADSSKFPDQTPIGETVTIDYSAFNIPDNEAISGLTLGEPMMNTSMGTVNLVDGQARYVGSSLELTYNQPPYAGTFVSASPNNDYWDYSKSYIVCGINSESQLGRIAILMKYKDGAPGGWTKWYIQWSSVSDKAYNWILHNVVPLDLNKSGGAGSGYIGNSLLSNKKMVGYNVPTSSAESTKTESVNEASETPVANKPKIGNGFARIKFLRDVQPQPEPGYDDILNKLQNYIIWGSWNFKTQDMKEYYSGNRNITCDFPCAIINQGRTLQSSSWTSGTSYFCGGCRVDINGEDDVGYDIIITNITNTKPIHRDGVADDACNKCNQIIYLNAGATGIGRPSEDTLPSTVSYRYEYSTIKLRNALEMMINMVIGSCDLFVNGVPWILR